MGGIVVGVDGSAHAVDALRFAIEESGSATVRCSSSRCGSCPTSPKRWVSRRRRAGQAGPAARADVLQAQVDKALDGKPGPGNIQVELRTGNPVEVLVQLGRTADLLVVGAPAAGAFGIS